jgi:SAM-dependent methyltransferase
MTENYQGLTNVQDGAQSHLGGNLLEGDPYTYCPRVWDYLIGRFAVRSVLDLGSGMGYASQYFHTKGMKVIAVEGLPDNVSRSHYPCIEHDITQTPVNCRVDLVHCQEVVEHIEERYLDNLLDSLMCGRIIVMTNALPGQGGYHHVNEQPTEYWVRHLQSRGCSILVEDSNRVRNIAASEGAVYLAKTALVVANNRW